jgi:hypothetical protein
MSGQTRVIQARLNPDHEEERLALAVFDLWIGEGHAPRGIMTAAFNALGGTPVRESDEVTAIRNMIRAMQEDVVEAITTALESRLEEFSALAPAERRQQVANVTRSTIGRSILNAVDVADYEE